MEESIRIMIVDDHPIVREGLKVALTAQPDMELVAQARNGEEAVQKARATHPDVIIMDYVMPGMDGLETMNELNQVGSDASVLLLTSFPDHDTVFAAIKAGAQGVVLKDLPPEDLLDAVRKVHRGESALHPAVTRMLMEEVKKEPQHPLSENPLTPRELDVLRCLARGLTNAEIAAELSVSVRTVTTHVQNILHKLNLSNRTQAALHAREMDVTSS